MPRLARARHTAVRLSMTPTAPIDVSHARSFTATDAKKVFGKVLRLATQEGLIVITRRDEPEAVVLSYGEFQRLVHATTSALDSLRADLDRLFARMQTPTARKAMKNAFQASPARSR